MTSNNDNITSCVDCGNDVDVTVHLWDDSQLGCIYVEAVDGYICNDCIENYATCEDCNEIFHLDDMVYSDGYYYCKDCIPTYNFTIRNDYGESPEVEFYGTHKDGRFYGIELEIDDGIGYDDMLIDINDAVGDVVYFQYDGSLGYDGVEIITQPCSLYYHLHSLGWDEIVDIARDYEYKSHDTDTCGLHIHVSKQAFGTTRMEQDLNIAKMVIIFERFWDKIVQFSRRDYDKISRWAKKPKYKFYKNDTEREIVSKSKFSYDDRYSSINLQNSTTVEFRVFRGTLKVNTILASIQFIDVLIDYVLQASLEDVFEDSFFKMLSANKYQELTTYLNKRSMI